MMWLVEERSQEAVRDEREESHPRFKQGSQDFGRSRHRNKVLPGWLRDFRIFKWGSLVCM